MKKWLIFLSILACIILELTFPALAADTEVTVLFTHDLHSHLLPSLNEDGSSYGGYARLKTAIDAEKALYPDAIVVDGGDFSMGSLFQAVYATDAAELRIMGALGYDAATFGNHEYDYRSKGLAQMLNAAIDSGDPLPALTIANYFPPIDGDAEAQAVWDAFERYGVEDEYLVIQRGGVNFALFGLMGKDSDECAPMSGMVLGDPIATAKDIVETMESEVPEPRIVIALSHSGTGFDEPEDERLAEEVPGIDLIVSGHSHTTLSEPLQVGSTYIVSAGEYCHNLGLIRLGQSGQDGWTLLDYELIPIDDTLAEDPAISKKIEDYKTLVERSYLSQFGGMTFDEVVAVNPYVFDYSALSLHQESPLGNLIADSYRWAVQQSEGEAYSPVDFALTANGVIRATLPTGEVTVADVFNVSSLGIGADEVAGYPLVSVWITGKDLKNAFEVDASVTALMPTAQLYFTGMEFRYNPHRMIFNKVTDCAQVLEDGTRLAIEDDKLYRVVTGLYCGQMLGSVNAQSFGILNITPRDAEGNEITDLEQFILHDSNGAEIKEWYALASYLQSMGTITEAYSAPQGRKIAEPSWNPYHLLRGANCLTLVAVALVLVIVAVMALAVRKIIKRKKRT